MRCNAESPNEGARCLNWTSGNTEKVAATNAGRSPCGVLATHVSSAHGVEGLSLQSGDPWGFPLQGSSVFSQWTWPLPSRSVPYRLKPRKTHWVFVCKMDSGSSFTKVLLVRTTAICSSLHLEHSSSSLVEGNVPAFSVLNLKVASSRKLPWLPPNRLIFFQSTLGCCSTPFTVVCLCVLLLLMSTFPTTHRPHPRRSRCVTFL